MCSGLANNSNNYYISDACCLLSNWGIYSSNMPYGSKVTLDYPMRKTLVQIDNQGEFPRRVGCCERGLVLNARFGQLLYDFISKIVMSIVVFDLDNKVFIIRLLPGVID